MTDIKINDIVTFRSKGRNIKGVVTFVGNWSTDNTAFVKTENGDEVYTLTSKLKIIKSDD